MASNGELMTLIDRVRLFSVLWAPVAVTFGIVKITVDFADVADVFLGVSSVIAGMGLILFATKSSQTQVQDLSIRRKVIVGSLILFGFVGLVLLNLIITAIFVGYVAGVLTTLLWDRWRGIL